MNDVERLIASDAIRQLAVRYAVYLDARNLDALVALYAEDIRAMGGRTGRNALREDFDRSLRTVGITFLHVGNHMIDFTGDDRATGVVYCRAELQDGGPDGEQLIIQTIQYHDSYARIDGDWFFTRRKHLLVYGAKREENPLTLAPANWPQSATGMGSVPHDLETWQAFWNRETDVES